MIKFFFLIFIVLFLIFSFSTSLAYPIPISTTSDRRNLMLMGRVVKYSKRDVAMPVTPSHRDSDEPTTRAQRFRHRLIQQQRMQMGTRWMNLIGLAGILGRTQGEGKQIHDWKRKHSRYYSRRWTDFKIHACCYSIVVLYYSQHQITHKSQPNINTLFSHGLVWYLPFSSFFFFFNRQA